MYVLRLKYRKIGALKFVSHLETLKMVERSFRRAKLPLSFSQGFNPHPKMSFAAPLSVGIASDGEYMDVELDEKIDIDEFIKNHSKYFPKNFILVKGKYVEGKKKLMSLVSMASYAVTFETEKPYTKEEVENEIKKFMSLEDIILERVNKRKKKVVRNIRPSVKDIKVLQYVDKIMLKLDLSTGSVENLNPKTAVEKINEHTDIDVVLDTIRVHRIEMFAEKNGKYVTLMDY
jgi:radical SAM-linked protein